MSLVQGEIRGSVFQYYVKPIVVELQCVEMRYCQFDSNYSVKFRLGARTSSGLVPADCADAGRGVVTATIHGEQNGQLVVGFPPALQDETYRFGATREELEPITVGSAYLNRRTGQLEGKMIRAEEESNTSVSTETLLAEWEDYETAEKSYNYY